MNAPLMSFFNAPVAILRERAPEWYRYMDRERLGFISGVAARAVRNCGIHDTEPVRFFAQFRSSGGVSGPKSQVCR
jgi:hypothetical protein